MRNRYANIDRGRNQVGGISWSAHSPFCEHFGIVFVKASYIRGFENAEQVETDQYIRNTPNFSHTRTPKAYATSFRIPPLILLRHEYIVATHISVNTGLATYNAILLRSRSSSLVPSSLPPPHHHLSPTPQPSPCPIPSYPPEPFPQPTPQSTSSPPSAHPEAQYTYPNA